MAEWSKRLDSILIQNAGSVVQISPWNPLSMTGGWVKVLWSTLSPTFTYYPRGLIVRKEKSTPKLKETMGFLCLGHSNWTICIPLSPFCSGSFQFVSCSHWEANSYYSRGLIVRKEKSPNSKTKRDKGVFVPGAFKLDHLYPLKPILLWKFSTCFMLILGGQFLLTQMAISECSEITQIQKWIRQRGLCAWAIQSGPFASL